MKDYYIKVSRPTQTPAYLMYTRNTTENVVMAYRVPADVPFDESQIREHYIIPNDVDVEPVFIESVEESVDHLSAI